MLRKLEYNKLCILNWSRKIGERIPHMNDLRRRIYEMTKAFFVLPLLFLIALAAGAPDETTGRVVHVTDGDTFDVQLQNHDNRISEDVIRIRLADLDAPEMYGPKASEAGKKATIYTRSWLINNFVSLDLDNKNGQDEYGRWIAICY